MNSTKKIITIFACLMMVASPIVASAMQTSHNGIGDVEGIVPSACPLTIIYDGVSQQVSGLTTSTVEIPSSYKTGHTFLYWNLGGTPLYPGSYTHMVLCSMANSTTISLTSVWSKNNYTASFYDGPNYVSSKTCVFNEQIGTLPTVSKAGYTFLGWSPSCSTNDIISSGTYYTTPNDRTFYAVWMGSTYTVSLFNGDECVDTIECTYNEAYGTLPTLTKDGYTFKGWSTDKSGSNIVNSNTKYLKTTNSCLYAIWDVKQFTITFIDNGTEVGSKSLSFGSPIGTMPELSEKGRTFLGWSVDGTTKGIVASDKVFSEYGNVNLYSVWKINEYTVSLMNGDNCIGTVVCTYNSAYGTLPILTKEGHDFRGWATDKAGNNIVNSNTKYLKTTNSYLYAVWEVKQFTITFIDNGTEVGSKNLLYGSPIGTMPELSEKGRTFLGWSVDGTTKGIVASDKVFSEYGNVNLYSVWKINEYTVSLMNGDICVGTIVCTYNSAYGTLPTLTKEGYEFRGWATDMGGNDIVNSDTNYLKTTNSYLYAVWEVKQFMVYFIDNGTEVESKILSFGSTIGTMPELSEKGRTFLGWSVDGTTEGIVATDKVFSDYGDVNLYSVWKINEYTVSLINGDVCIGTVVCTYNSAYGTLPTLTKEGHDFRGWATDMEGNDIVNSNTKYLGTCDSYLYAVWETKQFTITFIDNGIEVGSKNLLYGSPIGTMPELSEKGRTFIGWSVDGTTEGIVAADKVFPDYGNVNLYSVWKVNEYTVTFMNNDSEMFSKTIAYGHEYGVLPTPNMAGHTFIGWSLDGTENNIIGPQSLLEIDSDIELYPVWNTNTYTIHFIDGVTEIETKDIMFGQNVGAMPSVICDGKEFVGWSLDGSERKIVTSIDSYDWEDDTVLYAVCKDIEQSISDESVIDDAPTESKPSNETSMSINPEGSSGSLFDNPVTIAALALIILGTIGISYWVYRKGLI